MLQGIFGVHVNAGDGPAETLRRVNHAMLRRAIPSRFATVTYGCISSGGRLTYCNAGHNPPVKVGRGGRRRLVKGGLPLGMFHESGFEEETVQLDCGDVVVAFTDGITEALCPDGTEFGEERLLSCVESHLDLTAAALVDRVLEAVRQFAGAAAQSDDLTVVVLRYVGTSAGESCAHPRENAPIGVARPARGAPPGEGGGSTL